MLTDECFFSYLRETDENFHVKKSTIFDTTIAGGWVLYDGVIVLTHTLKCFVIESNDRSHNHDKQSKLSRILRKMGQSVRYDSVC